MPFLPVPVTSLASHCSALWWIGDLCRSELQEEMLHHQSRAAPSSWGAVHFRCSISILCQQCVSFRLSELQAARSEGKAFAGFDFSVWWVCLWALIVFCGTDLSVQCPHPANWLAVCWASCFHTPQFCWLVRGSLPASLAWRGLGIVISSRGCSKADIPNYWVLCTPFSW